MTELSRVALRMDDVGASSKRYEVYARPLPLPGRAAHLGDVLFLKYLPPLKAWGPYRELSAEEWRGILEILRREGGRMTVAVTAAWVTWAGSLISFPERFPEQAEVIRAGVGEGLLEVANHGLTHCLLEGHAFRPRLFSGNRRAHREFWDWVPLERQFEHLRRAQELLQEWLTAEVVTFVPPGNVFGETTLEAAERVGLRIVSCATSRRSSGVVRVIGNDGVIAFHDRDVIIQGVSWLRDTVAREARAGRRLCFVRDLLETCR